jgi:hypothetical protein
MPRASCEQQASGLLLQKLGPGFPPSGRSPSQQSFEVPPHAKLVFLQTSPGRRHWRKSHRPKVSPAAIVHAFGGLYPSSEPFTRPVGRPGPPQQSSDFAQSSFCGLHPEGGWQTLIPVVPRGPHESEQQVLLQPAVVQSVPAGLQGAPPIVAQRPSAAPPTLSQLPPQHSASVAHESPVCVQYERLAQCFVASHCFEQHSSFVALGLPSVRHVPPPSARHLPVAPISHLPLQHSSFVVQASAGESALHCVAEHLEPMHAFVQHCGPLVHAASAGRQLPPLLVEPLLDAPLLDAPLLDAPLLPEAPLEAPLLPEAPLEAPSRPPSPVGTASSPSLPHPAKTAFMQANNMSGNAAKRSAFELEEFMFGLRKDNVTAHLDAGKWRVSRQDR